MGHGGLLAAQLARVGGGGAPGVPLPGWAVRLPESLAAPLRAGLFAWVPVCLAAGIAAARWLMQWTPVPAAGAGRCTASRSG